VRKWLIAALVVIVVVVVGLVAVDVLLMRRGCGSIDPTDAANYSEVVIRNDTAQRVQLSECRGAYCQVEEPRTIAPGAQVREQAACAASGGDMTSWKVRGADGTIGYIAIDTPKKHDGLVYLVSAAGSSRLQATPAKRGTDLEP
jgi:hypothetical protein